jgi:hypothetical protein
MSAVALALGKAASAGREGERGGGGSVWANSSSSARWPSGRGLQRRRLKAQGVLADGPYMAQGGMVCGVKCASALFATPESQDKAHQDETREVLYENSRLHMASEGKPHRERAMDGKFRCAASPDDIPH